MKSHTRFRLVPNSTTLDDLEVEGSLIMHSVSKHIRHGVVICFFTYLYLLSGLSLTGVRAY